MTRVAVLGFSGAENVLTRAGSLLLEFAAAELFSGVPRPMWHEAAQRLRQTGWSLWVHADADGRLRAGHPRRKDDPDDDESDISVLPVAALGTPDDCGVLCIRSDTQAVCWMPGDRAAWVRLTPAQLERHLVRPGKNVPARLLPDRTVSLIDSAQIAQRFEALRVGDPIRVVITDEPAVRTAQPGRARYLARAHLLNVLLEFESSHPGHLPGTAQGPDGHEENLVTAEISRRRPGTARALVAVGLGERTITVDLPEWVIALATGRLTQPPPEFDSYVRAYTGRSAALEPVTDRLIRAAGDLSRTGAVRPDGGDAVLREWLAVHGEDAFGLRTNRPLDLFPALCAVVLMDAAGSPAAVPLCRRLGLRAARSRHVEPIVGEWLTRPERLASGRLWKRLAGLTWDQHVSPSVFEAFYDNLTGILSRTSLDDDAELRQVVTALLAAIGRQPDFDQVAAYDGCLAALTALGRALTPSASASEAQARLLPEQRDLIAGLLQEMVDTNAALTLLPPHLSDGSVECRRLLDAMLRTGEPMA